MLYKAGADVILSGHEHNYERFTPQTATGRLDRRHGIREFVVGTGGKSHYQFGNAVPNSIVRNNDTFGVLRLVLHRRSYSWAFVPVAGGAFHDAGKNSCHR